MTIMPIELNWASSIGVACARIRREWWASIGPTTGRKAAQPTRFSRKCGLHRARCGVLARLGGEKNALLEPGLLKDNRTWSRVSTFAKSGDQPDGRSQPCHAHDNAYEPIETASRDEISALQLERLRWSLRHAYENVEHYRRKFDAHGAHPDDLKTLDDLRKFPFTTKDDLRQNYPFKMFAVPREQVVRVHASSGTTGQPTVVGYTQNDIDMWATLMARSIHAAGGRRGDMVHIGYGYGLFTGGLGAHYGAERLGCTVIPMSGGQTEKQVQLIADFQPDIIMVTPSYLLNLADEFKRQRIDPASTGLRVGLFGAEPWTQQMRLEIEGSFAIDAIDLYGLSEVIGPGVASECIESKDGPVIWEDHFYPEVIDPATGEVFPTAATANWCSRRCPRKRCR
jgi:phenylacetate-CoA ligase